MTCNLIEHLAVVSKVTFFTYLFLLFHYFLNKMDEKWMSGVCRRLQNNIFRSSFPHSLIFPLSLSFYLSLSLSFFLSLSLSFALSSFSPNFPWLDFHFVMQSLQFPSFEKLEDNLSLRKIFHPLSVLWYWNIFLQFFGSKKMSFRRKFRVKNEYLNIRLLHTMR
jgi:hypothetical protein